MKNRKQCLSASAFMKFRSLVRMQESVITIYNNYVLYGWQKFLTTDLRHCDKECELSHKSLNYTDDRNFQITVPSVYLQYKII
jgi:hypothetical protein